MLESQKTTFMKFYAVTAIWPNKNHSSDDKLYEEIDDTQDKQEESHTDG